MEVLIPYRPPMRWIDELVQCGESTATAETTFGADHFVVEDGRVAAAALVECMAQTVAAAMAWREHENGAIDADRAVGMLASVSRFEIHYLPAAGLGLTVNVRQTKQFGRMLVVEGTVAADGRCCAEGELTLYV